LIKTDDAQALHGFELEEDTKADLSIEIFQNEVINNMYNA